MTVGYLTVPESVYRLRMRPVDGVTLDEAAHILGCSLRQNNQKQRVSRADAEALT